MTHAEMGSTAVWLMLLLGAYHGINPGMGWLFAVALGMQEQKGSAVARALVPIALGHALAIGSVVMAVAFLGMALPREAIRYSVAAILLGLGIFSLVRHYHPRWVRMQVGFRDLTIWSFLMASAHGASLMVLPVLLGINQARFRRFVRPGDAVVIRSELLQLTDGAGRCKAEATVGEQRVASAEVMLGFDTGSGAGVIPAASQARLEQWAEEVNRNLLGEELHARLTAPTAAGGKP